MVTALLELGGTACGNHWEGLGGGGYDGRVVGVAGVGGTERRRFWKAFTLPWAGAGRPGGRWKLSRQAGGRKAEGGMEGIHSLFC